LTEATKVLGGAFVLGLGLVALPADLTSPAIAADAPNPAAVEPVAPVVVVVEPRPVVVQPPAGPVEAAVADVVIEENRFGVRMFDPSADVVDRVSTEAAVVARPGGAGHARGLVPVDAAQEALDGTPLPLAEGAELVESGYDGWRWVAVSIDAERSVAAVERFYTEAFSASYDVDRQTTGGTLSLRISLDGRMVGWVGIIADGEVVKASVIWTG
jgi:hypothetical protein